MKSLLNFALLGALSLNLAACGDDLVGKVESWKKSACACKDKECAEKQAKAFISLTEKFKDAKPSKSDMKKLDKAADEGQECLEEQGVDVYDMM